MTKSSIQKGTINPAKDTKSEIIPKNQFNILHFIQYLLLLVLILWRTNVLQQFIFFDRSFQYMQGITPLTSPSFTYGLILFYILSIKVLQGIMKSRDPVEVKEFTLYHNTILVFFSAVLTLGISSVVFPYMYHHGIMNSLCNPDLHSNSFLQLMYYLNYLLKFYEHLDTYVLILKKKRVIFLHWYHHASTFLLLVTHIQIVTVLLTYIQLNTSTTVQWVPILCNVIVHVLMYSYYLLSSMQYTIWWKKCLTQIQIIQFIIDIIICVFTAMQWVKDPIACPAESIAVYSGIFIILSYLILFLQFFVRAYMRPNKTKEKEQ